MKINITNVKQVSYRSYILHQFLDLAAISSTETSKANSNTKYISN